MHEQIGKSFGFLKTTGIGGLLFLLPLVVIAGLLGYVFQFVLVVYEPLKEWIPVKTATGIGILFLAAVSLLVLMCFAAGVMARRAIGRKFSRTIEKQLVMVFPKYAIYKDLIAGNIGGDAHAPTLHPIMVRVGEHFRLAFESDRLENGMAVVYFPGAPDTWIGYVGVVPESEIQRMDLPLPEALGICERLGRDSRLLLANVDPMPPRTDSQPDAR